MWLRMLNEPAPGAAPGNPPVAAPQPADAVATPAVGTGGGGVGIQVSAFRRIYSEFHVCTFW